MNLLLALAALGAIGAGPADKPVPVHIGGRVIHLPDGSASFGWPGTYFEGRFRGTAVRVHFEAPAEYMRLFIDGEEKLLSKRTGRFDSLVAGLPDKEHVVRLEKLTESQTGGGLFRGFFTNGEPLPRKGRVRQIEFIGDSYTLGYGNTSATRTCPGTMVHDTTDTQQAFGPLLAKRLDADYRINAYSGFGIVRNYDGGVPASSLPAIYPRLKPDNDRQFEGPDRSWQPQLVVINLGTNDFSTPLKPGERWRSDAELKAAYRSGYVQFVRDLQRSHSQAQFVLMGSDQFIAEVEQVAAELNRGAARQVSALRFSGLDYLGCDHHPSLADDRLLADLLQREIQRLQIWQ
ncbi:MAG TPA: SGNH/GDSL hydrolase family protein [Sphingomicrobium sp.]